MQTLSTSLASHPRFPLSHIQGATTDSVATEQLQQRAARQVALTAEQLQAHIEAHHCFLGSGGAGGRWQIVVVKQVSVGIYLGASARAGAQAILDGQHLTPESLADADGLQLPFMSGCALYAPDVELQGCDMSYSLLIDAHLRAADFERAELAHTDFSRADLREVSFVGANLRYCDFENCDLRGADFRGALLEGSRFPGAQLVGAKQ